MAAWTEGPPWISTLLAATEPEQAEAGPTALLIVLLLGIGIFFLGRSMIKQMRRVPQSFDPPPDRETDTSRETDGRETDGRETPPSG